MKCVGNLSLYLSPSFFWGGGGGGGFVEIICHYSQCQLLLVYASITGLVALDLDHVTECYRP